MLLLMIVQNVTGVLSDVTVCIMDVYFNVVTYIRKRYIDCYSRVVGGNNWSFCRVSVLLCFV